MNRAASDEREGRGLIAAPIPSFNPHGILITNCARVAANYQWPLERGEIRHERRMRGAVFPLRQSPLYGDPSEPPV
jgi:hypothetical protein